MLASRNATDHNRGMTTRLDRRKLMQYALAAAGTAVVPAGAAAATGTAKTSLTDADWRQRLSPMTYYVLRQEGTERPFTSPLLAEARAGRYACAGCGSDLFASHAKFDVGTGWPCFHAALPGRVATREDRAQGLVRTTVHCRGCGGHLGHRYDGKEAATGRPHLAINGAALSFRPL